MSADWPQLPSDLLVEIGKRINSIEDYLSFGSVCKSWRSSASKDDFNSDLPWLMLAEEEGEDSSCRQFFSLCSGKILKKAIPEARGKRCMESMGWLITVGEEDGEISLLHPFSGVKIELPHQDTAEEYEVYQTGDPWTYFSKAVLSDSPSRASDYVVMVIDGSVKFLSFWRPGDLKWTRLRKPTFEGGGYSVYRDVIYCNGKFYAVDWVGRVCVCDVSGPDPTQVQVVAQVPAVPPPPPYTVGEEFYIVESLGSLFVVVRYGVRLRYDRNNKLPLTRVQDDDGYDYGALSSSSEDEDEDEGEEVITYGTTHILVFELDLAAGQLTETKELGDTAIFIGHSASLSVQASQFPGIKPNHVYFTDDYAESYLEFNEGGGLDMGVLNLEDGKIEPHYKGVSVSRVGPPIWVTPTLC